MCYTPPAGRYGTTDAEHNAYMAAHSAGWRHANFANAYGAYGETVEQVAARWAEAYPEWASRAAEGFTDGAEAFEQPCADCGESEA